MRFAYADPPYLGQCARYDHFHGVDGRCWDDPATHVALIERLASEFPDGWALSATTGSLRLLLAAAPEDARVGAWVKPWCSFKPNVHPAYAWEPVLFRGGRRRTRQERTARDWVSISADGGHMGAKPKGFSFWIFDMLGARDGDDLVDLFPGTGAVGAAWDLWLGRTPELFGAPSTDGR